MSNTNNFNWRPNDNSSKTLIKYDLEAKHWVKAFESATTNTSLTFLQALGLVGLILSFTINVILIVFFLLGELYEWIFENKKRKSTPKSSTYNPKLYEPMTKKELEFLSKNYDRMCLEDLKNDVRHY